MTKEIDYATVDVPDGDDYENWHYTHRRAYLLREINDRGTPAAINQSRMGERFGCSQANIHNDLKALAEYINQNAGGPKAAATAESVFQAAVRELAEAGEWKDAAKVAGDWMDWLQNTGKQERAPSRHEVDADIRTRRSEAAYRVVEHVDGEEDADGDALPPGSDAVEVPLNDDGGDDGFMSSPAAPDPGDDETDDAA